MRIGQWRLSRRQALTVLLLLLLAAPIPLAYISRRDNLEPPTSGFAHPAGWIWFLIGTVVLILALRGNVSALTFCAWVYVLLGVGSIVGSFFAPNGPLQLATDGSIGLATAVVFLLIRAEVETASSAIAPSATVDTTSVKATP